MKILLSAFACAPHVGSEPEVGWKWAVHLAEAGHEVWVLTRREGRAAIEAELARMPGRKPRFVFYDATGRVSRRAEKSEVLLRLYYVFWQWRAGKLARTLHEREVFDRVHHVTYAGLRAPSFMGDLGIPFVFGPVGGGERAPLSLRSGYGLKGWLIDAARDIANLFVRVDPFLRRTLVRATKIYVTSSATLRLLPAACRKKAAIELAIGCEERGDADAVALSSMRKEDGVFRILYVGQFLYLKGMHLGLPAFAALAKSRPDARLTMIGSGPEEERWRTMAERLGIADRIDWLPWLPQAELARFYATHDVLLFPSLHDPGGMVVLEGMTHGLPVVCLAIGGPGILVTEDCGRVVEVTGRKEAEIIARLGQALRDLADPELRDRLAAAARRRCDDFRWKKKVARIYEDVA